MRESDWSVCVSVRSPWQPLVMGTSSRSPGTDAYWLQPSLWLEFHSLLFLLWVTLLFTLVHLTQLNLYLVQPSSPVSLSVCLSGDPGLWFCPEGSGAAPTETLWKETKPSCWTHTGEPALWCHSESHLSERLILLIVNDTSCRIIFFSCRHSQRFHLSF